MAIVHNRTLEVCLGFLTMKSKQCLFTISIILLLLRQIAAAQVPTITDFNPKSGPVGTAVTINGTNFDTTPSNNIVYFGAVKATITAATSTSLSVTVPVGATYHPITVTVFSFTAYSSKPFIVTFAGGGAITSASFATKVDYGTGNYPDIIVIGDLDGDGKPDLSVSNFISGDFFPISVFRNTGTIGSVSFAANVDFTAGFQSADGAAIGDVTGDGKLDLVVTSLGNRVSVLQNTSTGGSVSFAARVDFSTGLSPTSPYSVAIDDVDGDGKPDIAVANYGTSTVSIFRNTSTSGSLSFARVDFTAGSRPYHVAFGDVNDDRKPDLAVTDYADSTVSVFQNTSTIGNVSFAEKVDFTTGSRPYHVAIGDVDGDGKPDLAVVNYATNTVSIFRNTGTSGSVSFDAKVDFTTGSYPHSFAIGDIDGDGKPDLAVANPSSNTVSVLKNTSTTGTITANSFAAKVDFTTGTYPWSVAIGDIDGDGKSEMAVANLQSNTVSVFRNTIIGSNTAPSAPQNLTAYSGDQIVTLKWSKNTESDFLRYHIYGGTSSSPTTKIDSTTGSISDTTRTVGGLTNGTTYYFRITAVDSAGLESGYSNEVNAKPFGVPTITSFTPTLVSYRYDCYHYRY